MLSIIPTRLYTTRSWQSGRLRGGVNMVRLSARMLVEQQGTVVYLLCYLIFNLF